MKKLLLFLCATGLAFGLVSPAAADMLVPDNMPYTNPQYLHPSSWQTEKAWLEGLLGGATVYYYGKDEDNSWNDNVWTEGNPSLDWTYAVLKYGVGKPRDITNPDHWAIWDNNYDNIVDFVDIVSSPPLPSLGKLSHITYFGDAPVPEPATMLLLGSGLIALGVLGRKKLFKKS